MTTAEVLKATLESVNESDSNFEPANVVDGLFAVSRAIRALAHATALAALSTGSGEIEVKAFRALARFAKLDED